MRVPLSPLAAAVLFRASLAAAWTRPATGALSGHAFALLSISVALAVALLLQLRMASAPVSLFIIAIMLSTWYGGARPGLVSVLLANLALIYYFVTPLHSLAVAPPEQLRVVLFALATLSVAWLTATLRSTATSLGDARDELRRTVAELQSINRTLQQENAQRRSAEQALEQLPGRLINAQEQERRRIGRELHDHIIQMLCLLTIKIDQLRAGAEITPRTAAALAELRRDTSGITDDVHGISHRLHPATLDYLGLLPALESLVSELGERHGVAISLSHRSVPPTLPPEVALGLFRVAEEALTNIARHSKAASASVQVIGVHDGLHLKVEDAGDGFDMATLADKSGLGFVSMQERLRLLHGTMRVDSGPSRGTRIAAWVPATW